MTRANMRSIVPRLETIARQARTALAELNEGPMQDDPEILITALKITARVIASDPLGDTVFCDRMIKCPISYSMGSRSSIDLWSRVARKALVELL
ncbi:hypothetical protein HZC07_01080, partial [Candidatus Micrarchaeota archaeon]|nr:hypothetical protein [Candidatus Micrarchaeota archaeon]